MDNKDKYIYLMNDAIKGFFLDGLKISLRNPSLAYNVFRMFKQQKKAASQRLHWEEQGIHVPPYMIISITNRCNLNCKGCYAHALHKNKGVEMSEERLRNLISEAKGLGISLILLAGGEPLVRSEILDIAGEFPEIVFPVFTNGLLINNEIIEKMKRFRNIIPVISLEGYEEDTDNRRGEGVYEHAKGIAEELGKKNIFYGVSLTYTSHNCNAVTDNEFIKSLVDLKCKLFLFVEYVAVKKGTEDWIPTDEQRVLMPYIIKLFRQKFPALFTAFPGDEEKYGGCMSAGRGFVHVSPDGRVEPCPFAPYSDVSLEDLSLKDALQSDFLKTIRQNHHQLTETRGGCVLWEKRDWVQSLLVKRTKQ